MKYTRLGTSDLKVSCICMGFGDPTRGQHSWTLDEEQSRGIIRQGLENGINFFDTAIAYQSGTSERYFGRALRDFAKFISVQGHYNLIFREEERETAPLCRADNIAMTPYSALAGGRLSRRPGESSRRLREDSYARLKYDNAARQDEAILERAAQLADSKGASMTEISLAWLLTKVTAPVVGATKRSHVDGMAKAAELSLTPDEIAYLEECYLPHPLVGVMAQNTAATANETHVWSTGDQKLT